MFKNTSRRFPLGWALCLGVFAAPAAGAQPALEGYALLEEVIVTAQKREQSIQDVGISVTALSGSELMGYQMWEGAVHEGERAAGQLLGT